jgi:hypothetical protein
MDFHYTGNETYGYLKPLTENAAAWCACKENLKWNSTTDLTESRHIRLPIQYASDVCRRLRDHGFDIA